jgi:hypothetical protein
MQQLDEQPNIADWFVGGLVGRALVNDIADRDQERRPP